MTYNLLSLLLVTIVCFLSNNCYALVYGDIQSCDLSNSTVIYSNSSLGSLKIKNLNDRRANESKCVWIIDTTGVKDSKIHLDISQLSIGVNDTLKIVENDAKSTTLYELRGYQSPGVILTNAKNVTVTLSLTNETIDRKFDVVYNSNETSAQLQNIEATGSYVFAYYNAPLDLKTDFNLMLATSLQRKNILINIQTLDLNGGKVSFDNVVKIDSSKTFDNTTKPPFLLSKDRQINIKITGFNTKDNPRGIRLNYELVDSICSQYTLINKDVIDKDDMINVKLPNDSDLNSLTSFKCFNLFEHENPNAILLFDLSIFKFTNTYDTITVLDGDSRDSKTLALVEYEFFDVYWKQLYLYSSTNKLWVIYESPLLINKTTTLPILGVRPKSQGGTIYLTGDEPRNLVLTDTHKSPVIFNLEVDEGYQAVIDFEDNQVLPGDANKTFVTIYESTARGGKPLIRLESKNYPPNIMASNTNQMKIEFNQTASFKATLQRIKKGCHSSVSDISSSYSLSGCNALCSWLVPNRETKNGTYILKFSHLNLPEKTDTVYIEKIGLQKSNVFKLNGPLKTMTFPDLNLDPSFSYVLYTERKCSINSTDNTDILGVALTYVTEDLISHSMNISNDPNKTISSEGYPNYYSVGSDHLWHIDGEQGQNVLLTLTDLDLTANHQLNLISPNKSDSLTNNNVLSQISDYLTRLPLFLNLSSRSIGTEQPFSARGFRANLTTVECGESITLQPSKALKISTPSITTGISKCIWTLTVPNDKTGLNLINFNVTFGKDVDKNNNGLKVYDSNSLRNNQLVNLTYFNGTKSSSTNSIIVVYTISDPKKDLSLTLDFNTITCNSTLCENSKRCLLKEFFCNGFNDCGDWSDERNCKSDPPTPPPPQPPPPQPQSRSGVNGWVVLFIICPLCIGLGVAGTLFGPNLMSRFRRGRYREFQDFSEVS